MSDVGVRQPHTEADAERLRMVLAEGGHPDALVGLDPFDRRAYVTGASHDVVWRAFVVARVYAHRCRACFFAERPRPECLAPGLYLDDCGLS